MLEKKYNSGSKIFVVGSWGLFKNGVTYFLMCVNHSLSLSFARLIQNLILLSFSRPRLIRILLRVLDHSYKMIGKGLFKNDVDIFFEKQLWNNIQFKTNLWFTSEEFTSLPHIPSLPTSLWDLGWVKLCR